MDEYIKREDVLERTYWELDRDERRRYGIIYRDDVERIKAADVAPVMRGRWVRDHDDIDAVRCSNCGHKAFALAIHVREGKYCPFCGARMDSYGSTAERRR